MRVLVLRCRIRGLKHPPRLHQRPPKVRGDLRRDVFIDNAEALRERRVFAPRANFRKCFGVFRQFFGSFSGFFGRFSVAFFKRFSKFCGNLLMASRVCKVLLGFTNPQGKCVAQIWGRYVIRYALRRCVPLLFRGLPIFSPSQCAPSCTARQRLSSGPFTQAVCAHPLRLPSAPLSPRGAPNTPKRPHRGP